MQLNHEQQRAVDHIGSPLCVFAGPGTGKTLVLQKKYEYLIKEIGIHPVNIIGLTFTTSAANELINRINKSIGLNARSIQISTFHSQCNKMIQRHPEKCGLKEGFTLMSPEQQEEAIFEIIQELGIIWNQRYIQSIRESLCRAKRQGTWGTHLLSYAERLTQEIYPVYQHRLKTENKIDFEDMLIKANQILKENNECLNEYKERFQYVLVDECQDMDENQYKFIQQLKCKNTTIVGDDDQSIYGFAGSNVKYIRQFIDEFEAKTITLQNNYRSTETIIKSSEQMIENNTDRITKNLKHNKPNGDNIQIMVSFDETQEAENISKIITELDDAAILYRQNKQSLPIETVFQEKGIPYKAIDGVGFYHRKDIKNATALITLLYEDDPIAFKRALSIQPNIGPVTIQKIMAHANQRNLSLLDACLAKTAKMTTEQHETLKHFALIYRENKNKTLKQQAESLIKNLLPYSGKQAEERIKTFIESLSQWNHSIESFLQHIAHLDTSPKTIKMLTLHKSKGMEFNNVIIAGFEQGLLPYYNSIYEEEIANLEEERRLAYVGITRAASFVLLSYTRSRTFIEGKTQQHASQFIDEIPNKYKEYL